MSDNPGKGGEGGGKKGKNKGRGKGGDGNPGASSTGGPPPQQQPPQNQPQQQQGGGKKKGKGQGDAGAGQPPAQQMQKQQPTPQQQPPAQQQKPPQPEQQTQDGKQQQGGGKKKGKGGVGDAGTSAVTAGVQKMAISSSSGTSVSSSGSGVAKGLYQIPKRSNPKGGTLGYKTKVDTNHFAITFKDPKIVIFHYDVAIDPDKPKVHMRQVISKVVKQYFPNSPCGFDGRKNLFSKGQLPFGIAMNCTVTVFDEERMKDKEYKVEIKKAQEINFASINEFARVGGVKPQIAIQALDVILREPSSLNPLFVKIGSSFFSPPDPNRIIDLGDGLHLWNGFYQSAGIGWRPFLNLDVAHKGFPVQTPVVEIIREIGRGQIPRDQMQDWDKETLKQRVGGMKVIYQIPNQPASKKIYKVNKIVGSALTERFKPDQGAKEITIADYFQRSKNYKLQYPNLPCFQVGSIANNSRIPAELCTVLGGQISNKKMNEGQTAAMVKAAATGTDIRRGKVMDAMRKINFGGSALLQNFGISVSNQMERVDARILDPPSVGYAGGRELRVEKGVWRAGQFLKPCEVNKWAIVNMVRGNRPPNWRALLQYMPQGAQSVGVRFARDPEEVCEDSRENDRNLAAILSRLKQKQVQVVFVIVPNAGDTYAKVKQIAELEVGILTQCIKEKTVFKLNPATAGNLLLKINAKLNCTNHFVKELKKPKILGKPTIIFGADVTHPSPDETTIPSVAAVTASYDPAAFKYNMMWNLQDPRQEIIVDLESVVRTQLQFFIKVNNRKPLHIIYYRDGVSDGFFQAVMSAELTAIKRACQSIESSYNPPITFLVVQKRHHTRFFPCAPNEGDGSRNNNVRPGTIVDTTITHPTDLDFYLVSHASIQGTARPTKYYRLWDEYNLTDDETQEMTYYLCHLFARCTRAVSYPAPTYYAHLAAFRGRVYIKNRHLDLNNLPRENSKLQAKADFLTLNPMYFV